MSFRHSNPAETISRREFLRVGSLSMVGLSMAEDLQAGGSAGRRSCLFLLLTGGPSQFETFDPKPHAPSGIRGPLKAVSTAVPGVVLSESLPGLAQRTDQVALLRSLHHQAAPIHETGQQLLQTGRLAHRGRRFPSFGSVLAHALGPRGEVPPNIVVPGPLGNTGVKAYQGQNAGFLGADYAPSSTPIDSVAGSIHSGGYDDITSVLAPVPESLQEAYGDSRFGRLLLKARQLVEAGARSVTVNLFDSLAGQKTWDAHGYPRSAPATLFDYRDNLGPQFDRAFCALLDDLQQTGLLDETLVVAVGEFGRTPKINQFGGRDHWPGVFSAVMAGCGIGGGQVLGASDSTGSEPADRPVSPAELTATIYDRLGLDPQLPLLTEQGEEMPLVDAQPIGELFA